MPYVYFDRVLFSRRYLYGFPLMGDPFPNPWSTPDFAPDTHFALTGPNDLTTERGPEGFRAGIALFAAQLGRDLAKQ